MKLGALVLLVVLVLCQGCGGRSGPYDDVAVELQPNGTIRVLKEDSLEVRVPPEMMLTREIRIRSNCSQLSALTVSTSCGCTDAYITSQLSVGEATFLSCTLRGDRSQSIRKVNILLRSIENAGRAYIIPLVLHTDATQSHLTLMSRPRQLSVSAVWSPDFIIKSTFSVTSGSRIRANSFDIRSSASFINASLSDRQTTPDSLNVSIELLNPPVGRINEFVEISHQVNSDTIGLRIPIIGDIAGCFSCEPSNVNLGSVAKTARPTNVIILTRQSKSQSIPDISIEGDWELTRIDRIDDVKWRVTVRLKQLTSSNYCYGLIKIEGGWSGVPLSVPLTAVLDATRTGQVEIGKNSNKF